MDVAVTNYMIEDLRKSGLVVSDMNVRQLDSTSRHATGSPQQPEGYVIPYYEIGGKALPFYRVKLKGWDPKYKQLSGQPNHIYFPRGFWDLAASEDTSYIVFTEGEKKAACCVKNGIAACAAGGVDSWSNKTITLPKDAKLTKGVGGQIVAKIAAGDELGGGAFLDDLAVGMRDLIDLIIRRNIPIVIIYDSDEKGRVAPQVQAAAAKLGYTLRFYGIPSRNIRQFIIQPPPGFFEEQIGLDDLLNRTKITAQVLDVAIKQVIAKKSAFPRHPNPREFINKRLKRSRLNREQLQSLATSILCDLDANGSRLYSPDEDRMYYFSRGDKSLMRVSFRLADGFANSDWGKYLYKNYNLSSADERVLEWLETMYAGEEPVTEVKPERAIAVRDNAIYYQISQGQMIRVNSKEIRVLDNGSDDILFLSNTVQDLDKLKLIQGINRLLSEETLPNYWFEVLQKTRIQDNADKQQAKLLSYLYCISPWFYKWQGTQLPVEMVVGEPGSGKSTIYQLRLSIITGDPRLRNPPKDIDNWGVSVAATGGIHVTDNVNLINGTLRQQISDEMCRLITEPNPTIEKRKLYSDDVLIQMRVKAIFAITSVRQPFQAPDIIQRSVITYMDKGDEAVTYHGDWANAQLEAYGGREGWVAQQLVCIHRLLKKIETSWDSRYRAKFRLVNIEQLLLLLAELFGDDPSWIVEYMETTQAEKIAENDNVLGALRKFSSEVVARYGQYNKLPKARFTVKDICDWMSEEEDFKTTEMLTNTRKLGKFMRDSVNLLATVAGISQHGTINNAACYIAHDPKT